MLEYKRKDALRLSIRPEQNPAPHDNWQLIRRRHKAVKPLCSPFTMEKWLADMHTHSGEMGTGPKVSASRDARSVLEEVGERGGDCDVSEYGHDTSPKTMCFNT
ncbi:hypothetical protein ElyMa_005523800 [Elysia marginata]|uniref:Uncharacterized protein n=1 Tax=Elysia marginata TaxID=1093978 RepID=A0AAV4EY04_9GAST|nr:hypothetical protein ElyMa_005523800 [Elysia marginata]